MQTVILSRWGALMQGKLTQACFPRQLLVYPEGLTLITTRSLWMPWLKEDLHLVYKRVGGVRHRRGLFWDTLILDSPKGEVLMEIKSFPKSQAKRVVMEMNRCISDRPSKAPAPKPEPVIEREEKPARALAGRLRRTI